MVFVKIPLYPRNEFNFDEALEKWHIKGNLGQEDLWTHKVLNHKVLNRDLMLRADK